MGTMNFSAGRTRRLVGLGYWDALCAMEEPLQLIRPLAVAQAMNPQPHRSVPSNHQRCARIESSRSEECHKEPGKSLPLRRRNWYDLET